VGVGDRDPLSRPGQEREIVQAIPAGQHLGLGDPAPRAECRQRRRLRHPRRGDLDEWCAGVSYRRARADQRRHTLEERIERPCGVADDQLRHPRVAERERIGDPQFPIGRIALGRRVVGLLAVAQPRLDREGNPRYRRAQFLDERVRVRRREVRLRDDRRLCQVVDDRAVAADRQSARELPGERPHRTRWAGGDDHDRDPARPDRREGAQCPGGDGRVAAEERAIEIGRHEAHGAIDRVHHVASFLRYSVCCRRLPCCCRIASSDRVRLPLLVGINALVRILSALFCTR